MKRFLLFLFVLLGCAPQYSDDAFIGYEYLGARYLGDPLGESVAPDKDPLVRDDAFDCVTFVETSLAGGDVQKLNKIRYKNGEVDFVNRNHFIETDWLANNADIVADVTEKYGDTDVRHVVIDKQNWLKKVHGINADFPKQVVDLHYIPYDKVKYINVTKPIIVLFIAGNFEKSDIIGTDLAVRHMGFLLPGGVLRHASSQYGRVMDVDFYQYALARAADKNNLGVMLVEIK